MPETTTEITTEITEYQKINRIKILGFMKGASAGDPWYGSDNADYNSAYDEGYAAGQKATSSYIKNLGKH